MYRTRSLVAALAVAAAAPAALAAIIRVDVSGTVEFNVIAGGMAPVPDVLPVLMSFNVDSTNFVNNPIHPTRGYPLDLASFAMTVGGVSVPIVTPQPSGSTAYFVLRNNDPAVDGFFLSSNIDIPLPVSVRIPGLSPIHELNFLRTFNDGTPLPSLDILDALGTYGTENLSVYHWSIGRFGNDGAAYIYQSISLSLVPEPGTLMLGGVAAALLIRRRR